jgi:hypothetical protein
MTTLIDIDGDQISMLQPVGVQPPNTEHDEGGDEQ